MLELPGDGHHIHTLLLISLLEVDPPSLQPLHVAHYPSDAAVQRLWCVVVSLLQGDTPCTPHHTTQSLTNTQPTGVTSSHTSPC